MILAINVRFGEMTTDGYILLSVPVPSQTLIHVRASYREVGKIYQPALGLQAGPSAFAAVLKPVQGGSANWRSKAPAEWEASFELPPSPRTWTWAS